MSIKTIITSLAAVIAAYATAATVYGARQKSDAEKYMGAKIRVTGHDTATIPGKLITTYRRGLETWKTTNDIVKVNRPAAPIRYSKLKLIVAAKQAGKWGDVKAAITALDLEDEWNACQYVTSDYPAYIAATNAVIQNGIATQQEVETFMKMAED